MILRNKPSMMLICVVLFVILSCKVGTQLPFSQEAELRLAYEKYREYLLGAALTHNFSQLPDVITGNALEDTIAHLKTRKKYSSRFGTETEIISFEILESNETQATIQVKEYYRSFYLDPIEPGRRIYQSELHQHWYINQYQFVKEAGQWKVVSSEAIDWSG